MSKQMQKVLAKYYLHMVLKNSSKRPNTTKDSTYINFSNSLTLTHMQLITSIDCSPIYTGLHQATVWSYLNRTILPDCLLVFTQESIRQLLSFLHRTALGDCGRIYTGLHRVTFYPYLYRIALVGRLIIFTLVLVQHFSCTQHWNIQNV